MKPALLCILVILLIGITVPGASASKISSLVPAAGRTVRASVNDSGAGGHDDSHTPVISGDGRYVAFQSAADNLVPDDSNDVADIFIRDLETGQTSRISIGDGENQTSSSSQAPSISGGGRSIAFTSTAFDLVPYDANNVRDVFVRDRQENTTRRISVNNNGIGGNDVSHDPSISGDSRFVAFWSYASNLVDGDSNGQADVFLHDQNSHTTVRVSGNGDGDSRDPDISSTGRYVVFVSEAGNLVSGDSGQYTDIFLFDRETASIERVSVSDDEQEAQGDSLAPAVSGDGRYVVFVSFASNLIAGDTNNYPDVFVRDRHDGRTFRVNVSQSGEQVRVFEQDQAPDITPDGRYVGFRSAANNLVPGDDNGVADIFVRDLHANTVERASLGDSGQPANGSSFHPAISDDGRYVTFASDAPNLVPGDFNARRDIFVRDRFAPPPPPQLTINHIQGAVGSYFTVFGESYPPGSTFALFVNGRLLGDVLPVGNDGTFAVMLGTANATPGLYAVGVITPDIQQAVHFNIDPAGTVHPAAGDYISFQLPSGMALTPRLYLPLVRR